MTMNELKRKELDLLYCYIGLSASIKDRIDFNGHINPDTVYTRMLELHDQFYQLQKEMKHELAT